MIRVPLKEEEVYRLFGDSRNASREGKICVCFCNCDELEPQPRVRNVFSAFFAKLYEVREQCVVLRKEKKTKTPSGILTLRWITGHWKSKISTKK